MAVLPAKVLKVFISSTKLDLEAERKAAYDAVLKARHMPVGMEMFTSSRDPSWDTIKNWLDECDVYILILGGKYGSVDSKTKKSYTQMEYEYALKEGKSMCFCVLSDAALNAKVKELGLDAYETKNTDKYNKFKSTVLGSHHCEFWAGAKDIQLLIAQKLATIQVESPAPTALHGPTLIASNIPPNLAHYIRRPELMDKIRASLEKKEGVSLQAQLTAHGGFGKSVLAFAYGRDALEKGLYPGGAYFISCENRNIVEALSELLLITDETLKLGVNDKIQLVRSRLGQAKSLVVFDNVDTREQWLEFTRSGMYPNCDVLITTRANDIAGLSPIKVDHLTFEETKELLAKFSTSATEPENAAAIQTIFDETEGLAVLVAAVGGAQRHTTTPDDWNPYAAWLRNAPTNTMPGVEDSGYPNKTDAILDALLTKLHPAQIRILEYAAILPADRIRQSWLEWLLNEDTNSNDNPLDLGKDSIGTTYTTEWHLNELKQWDILRPLTNEEGIWSVHRLYRKRVRETALAQEARKEEVIVRIDLLDTYIWDEAEEAMALSHLSLGLELSTQNVEIWESIVAEGKKSPVNQNTLARAYGNRGISYRHAQNHVAAIEDGTKTVEIMEHLRDALLEQGEWHPQYQNDLANAYVHRGVTYRDAQIHDGAVDDYTKAIDIMEGLKERQWHLQLQDDLATAYMNRGVSHSDAQNPDAAIDDQSKAIGIMETLRDALLEQRQWYPQFQNNFANAYVNRGVSYNVAQNHDAAIDDYTRAIDIMETLRDALLKLGQWHPVYQNDLAGAYMNRGVSYDVAQNHGAAIDDFTKAIEIGTEIREKLSSQGFWHRGLRQDFVKILRNRAVAYKKSKKPGLAAADMATIAEIEAIEGP